MHPPDLYIQCSIIALQDGQEQQQRLITRAVVRHKDSEEKLHQLTFQDL